MSGMLHIVATPIGNLEDLTLRALRILKEADVIIAEDTRVSSKLLTHYDIDTHILSYHQHSSEEKKYEILKLLLDGKNLALITDAGTPGISDPGNELIDFIPIPGASAITSALSVSGFKTEKFVFIGFLPKKKRTKLFNWLKSEEITFAFYESPKRIVKSLSILEENFGSDTRIFVARELTKMFEMLYTGTIEEVKEMIKEGVKGEIVVVVEGK